VVCDEHDGDGEERDRMTETVAPKVPSEPFVSQARAFETAFSPAEEKACPHKLSSWSAVLTENFSSVSSFSTFPPGTRFIALGRSAYANASATASSIPGLFETSSAESEALKNHFPVCTF
jgi:hypothetical protein